MNAPSSYHRPAKLRRPCPACTGGLWREPRSLMDRLRALFAPPMARYRCLAPGCGWQGLLLRSRGASTADDLAASGVAKRQMTRRMVATGSLFFLLTASGAASWSLLSATAEWVQVGPRKLARGFSHDGDRLPIDHPLLTATSPSADTDEVPILSPAGAALTRSAEQAASAAASNTGEAALSLRRHCSWGIPGRNPYKGSVELALRTAKLPESVVKRIAADVQAKRITDRLSISNGSIRADGSGRRFDPSHVAMTYGRTLCVDTRVNFKVNHIERADLYEVADSKGNMVAVMVPDVCGNVSVLSEVADADDELAAQMARQEGRQAGLRRLPESLRYSDGPGGGVGARPAGNRVVTNAVPVPGTLACAVIGLAAALWSTRRRRRAAMVAGTAQSPNQAR
jgi:hypothetical protein